MSAGDAKAESLDFRQGREAAQGLWKHGLRKAQIDDPLTPDFAQGALTELERLQKGTAGVIIEALEGAEISAEQLNVQSFHGLIEVVQNAEDLGARAIRVAIRKSGRQYTLLITHDGDRIRIDHVIAMTLAYVSTKREDPHAKGRFGIGLKTLGRLGKRLKVHCTPYNFSIENNCVRQSDSSKRINGFYDPRSTDTLLELDLRPEFDIDDFHSWFSALGPQALVFLDNVRSLQLINLRSQKTTAHHKLKVLSSQVISLGALNEPCKRTALKEPRTGRSWVRYEFDKKVPPNIKRRHKAIGETTPIGIVLPGPSDDGRKIYAGLPLGITTLLPFNINAQFDIDTARRGIQHERLNEWLLARVADLVTGIALDRLENDPIDAWKTIPLRDEQTVVDDDWLSARITDLVETIQARVRRRFNIMIDGGHRRRREIAYEAPSVEGVIDKPEVGGLRPNHVLLPKNARDNEGRWRAVLGELGGATLIDVEEAISLFDWEDDDLRHRDVRWFIKLARVVLDKGLGSSLWNQRSVLTKSELRIVPPMPHVEGQLLVRSARPDSLASRLRLAHAIHPAYLSRWSDAVVVRKWLEENKMLRDTPDAESTLQALSKQKDNNKPIILNNGDLLALRDVFEEVTPEVVEELGSSIGRAISIDVQQWENEKRVHATASVSDAYLPASIEDIKHGWSKAAGRTPGIKWVLPHYEKLLQRTGRRRKHAGEKHFLAARKFFRLLGAEIAPRLVEPDQYETRYGDPASRIIDQQLLPSQQGARAEFKRYTTHLKRDRLSPDLAAVLKDLRRERNLRRRRERTRALVSTLARGWDRLYADHLTADAVYSSNSWYKAGSMPTTWIAMAMDEPWLVNELGKLTPARDLVVRTPSTEAIFGNDRQLFARDLDESDASSPLIRALRITTDPEVSELVDQLIEIRESGNVPDNLSLELRYAAIASVCRRRDLSPDDKVGDLTVRKLRARFGSHPTKPGLIYANGRWLPPSRVCLGAPIFGTRRAFVSDRPVAANLWRALRITRPSVKDCIEVLEEIAGEPVKAQDEQVLVNTYHYLEKKLGDATARDEKRLEKLPLWTGTRWTRSRPIFVTDIADVRTSPSHFIDIWQLPIATTRIPRLIEVTGAKVLTAASFNAIVHKNAFSVGASLQQQFKAATELLQDWLVRHDPQLAQAHAVPWDTLATPQVACDSDLQLELRVNRRSSLTLPARSHVQNEPLTFYFSDVDAVGEEEAGGQAVASLFTDGDRDKLALAWCHCWERAGRGERGAVSLAEDMGDETALNELFNQASNRKPMKRRSRLDRNVAKRKGDVAEPGELSVRKLKSLDQLLEKTVEKVKADAAVPSSKKNQRRGLRSKLPRGNKINEKNKPAPRSAPRDYSEEEKEELALQVLQLAINGEAVALRDYRHLRGVGADALDKLKRYFEIKAHFGPLQDVETLTGNEAERAFREREKFFLAVIGGLEEGYETVVKIFPNPLRNLDIKPNTSVILSGITKRKPAVEIRFPEVSSEDSMN